MCQGSYVHSYCGETHYCKVTELTVQYQLFPSFEVPTNYPGRTILQEHVRFLQDVQDLARILQIQDNARC